MTIRKLKLLGIIPADRKINLFSFLLIISFMAKGVSITEDNFMQLLANYTEWRYKDEIINSIDECTWDIEFENDEFIYKQLLMWVYL